MAVFAALSTLSRFRLAAFASRLASRRQLLGQGSVVDGAGQAAGGGAGVRGRGLAQAADLIDRLAEPAGWLTGFTASGRFIGFVALVVFAMSVGQEYRLGTLRSLLVVEPRRLQLLGGKLLALASLLAAAICVGMIAALLVAVLSAGSVPIPTRAWASSAPDAAAIFVNVWAAAVTWGVIGSLLAVAFRGNAPAIGVGLVYGLLGEPILATVVGQITVEGVALWLPSRALATLASGGSADMGFTTVLAVAVGYAVAATVGLAALVRRSDVTV